MPSATRYADRAEARELVGPQSRQKSLITASH